MPKKQSYVSLGFQRFEAIWRAGLRTVWRKLFSAKFNVWIVLWGALSEVLYAKLQKQQEKGLSSAQIDVQASLEWPWSCCVPWAFSCSILSMYSMREVWHSVTGDFRWRCAETDDNLHVRKTSCEFVSCYISGKRFSRISSADEETCKQFLSTSSDTFLAALLHAGTITRVMLHSPVDSAIRNLSQNPQVTWSLWWAWRN